MLSSSKGVAMAMNRATMLLRGVLAVVVLLAVGGVQAAPVPVLGLPVGGKPAKPLRLCPDDPRVLEVACWFGVPSGGERGGRSGLVYLPDPDGRPAWAAHAIFNATVAGDGRLERLTVKAPLDYETTRQGIVDSISARFGPPSWPTQSRAEWYRPGVHIQMTCIAKECTVIFDSARYSDERKRAAAVREARTANRPRSP